MTPEEIIRNFTHDPTGTDPTPGPFPDTGRIERRLAIAFAVLAALAVGLGVALGLRL